ncbi:MAG: CinA family protein [Coriobacteriaceae bacterium]|nr:CinA family protein [Coriobacteriaceae bacterium]
MAAASIALTDDLRQLAAQVVMVAGSRGISLGTAESCTGGLVAAAITSVTGASSVFKGAIVSYANEVKSRQLAVHELTLKEYGAVSEQTAREMACGALRALDVDMAVSVTGIAGPSGGSEDKPVGTVWFCVADDQEAVTRLEHFDGDREAIRLSATQAALRMLLERF